jgi:hypothetical protein
MTTTTTNQPSVAVAYYRVIAQGQNLQVRALASRYLAANLK